MRHVTRRRFVWMLAGAGTSLGLGANLASRFAHGESDQSDDELQQVTRESVALGSKVSITVLHRDAAKGKAAIDAAFAEMELVEDVMSIYRPASQLSQLNRTGSLKDPHPYFVEVLHAAQQLSRDSNGAFDVTVQPLWDLYYQASRRGEIPTASAIADVKKRIDWQKLHVTRSELRLDHKSSAITLNGIAQGFAADRVASTLRKGGVAHALIDTGEIGTIGAKADGDGWRVGIQHPRDKEAYVSIASLHGRCLATSGDYATTFDSKFRHHHLLDARTGQSPEQLASVSIVAPTALGADALSTAVFVMGAEAGLRLVQRKSDCDALLIFKDGRSVATPGFPSVNA